MEKRILFVSDSAEGFLITAMGKALEGNGYGVTYTKPHPKEIDALPDLPSIFIVYLDGDAFRYNSTLKYLGEKVSDNANKCYLYLIGNPIDIEAAYKTIPHALVSGAFERPVNTSDLVTELDLLCTDYSYDIDNPGVEHSLEGSEDTTKKSLLLVDDDSTLLRSMQRWLSKKYNVFITNSGMNTISFLRTRTVDLILLDYEMPVLSGLEVFQILKSDPNTAEIPVIFLTSKDDKNTVIKVLESKPASYLLKPMPPAILTQTVDDFFKKQAEAAKAAKEAPPPKKDDEPFLEELEPAD